MYGISRYGRFLSAIGLLICLLLSTVVAAEGVPSGLSDYRLGAGDQLQIRVFGEDDLSFKERLSDAGTISYPFLGELQVLGLRLGELEALITRGLKGPYLVNPSVNVTILEYRQFYINGEVKKAGGYAFRPGLTMRKAVAVAGGYSERAARGQVFVLRDRSSSEKPRPMGLNTLVMPGDIINVEESFF